MKMLVFILFLNNFLKKSVLAKKRAEASLVVPSNRRECMHLAELSALRHKLRTFNMLDDNAWTDFMLKLDRLKSSSSVEVAYTPYAPASTNPKERGFKAFMQVRLLSTLFSLIFRYMYMQSRWRVSAELRIAAFWSEVLLWKLLTLSYTLYSLCRVLTRSRGWNGLAQLLSLTPHMGQIPATCSCTESAQMRLEGKVGAIFGFSLYKTAITI